jgi:S-formylglutathione hydrolase FrmB
MERAHENGDVRRWAPSRKIWLLVIGIMVLVLADATRAGVFEPEEPQNGFGDTSMLDGWLPLSVQLISFLVFVLAILRGPRRWWTRWIPIAATVGVLTVSIVRWFIEYEGLAGDPAPVMFWIWTGLCGASLGVLALGLRIGRWWQRAASVLAVPLCLLCTVLLLNIWVGYARTTEAAWKFLIGGPLPNQTSLAAAKAMAADGTVPPTGRIVPISTGESASHFKHRSEYVYLPPVWFTSSPPPQLPALMLIGGEFGKSSDWVWSSRDAADAFASSHGGNAPVIVYVDAGGAFGKDTECVNGSYGNAADHLTKDVVSFVISNFGVSPSSANWGVGGWSMGGTCAILLTAMHPELFSTFVDIAGDMGPNAGNKSQTVDRLFGGDENAWAAFDPKTVMSRHGPYSGVSGVFAIESTAGKDKLPGSAIAAQALAQTAVANAIDCTIFELSGKHDWQFGASVFEQTLPWLAAQLGTPGVPVTAPPGNPVSPTPRGQP